MNTIVLRAASLLLSAHIKNADRVSFFEGPRPSSNTFVCIKQLWFALVLTSVRIVQFFCYLNGRSLRTLLIVFALQQLCRDWSRSSKKVETANEKAKNTKASSAVKQQVQNQESKDSNRSSTSSW